MGRWHLPTKLLGYIGAASSIVSVVALTVAIMALNSSVQQQTAQSSRDAQQAAVVAAAKAAQEASHQSACRFYAFTIGGPDAPRRSTAYGRFQLKEARKAFRGEGCTPTSAAPTWSTPLYNPLPTQPVNRASMRSSK